MVFDDLFRSLEPLRNPIGFGVVDFVELALALLAGALVFSGRLLRIASWISSRPVLCTLSIAILPVALRLLLLPHHPVPVPDLYDEFGHLFVADTLRHWRLANPPHPMHRFFETFFVLQQPTYSSIYPVGNGLALAAGWAVAGIPWAGVLFCVAAFCGLCYWMLRGWVPPVWALVGGALAIMQFGPLNQWTNSYWGGSLSAAAGCLVYGSLPRLREHRRIRDGCLLGAGMAIHLLTRPYESAFLVVSALLFFAGAARLRELGKPLLAAALVVLPAIGITLLHNKRVTGEWTELPYTLSQYQYGVPASLTFQRTPLPHVPLTREQQLDYRMQREFHPGADSIQSYFSRLGFRARYYRFYFYAPLYIALFAFLISIRTYRQAWIAGTCLLFACGINFFPAFQFHYMAAVVCLFILMSVEGLRSMARLPHGREAAQAVSVLCFAQFAFWYGMHAGADATQLDAWDSINHGNPQRRIEVANQLADSPGKLLLFVRYWPRHIFQDEWVYNGADIDGQRIVWARDLGNEEDKKLIGYYGDRKVLLLEPDARPPRLTPWQPAP